MQALRWDVFCRVIDNFGDIGVAWRLACDLAGRGHAVRLWLDDPSALGWMAPASHAGVETVHWTAAAPTHPAGDVVVETFGCEPPAAFVEAMSSRPRPPAWVNLEYLSAEPYVERSHGLPSPQQSGPGRGLTRWFYYPGFSERTGGLLREPGLLAQRQSFDAAAWLRAKDIRPQPGERVTSLFCYPQAPLDGLLALLGDRPTLLLLTPGAAQQLARTCTLPRAVRTVALPWLTQTDYDHLLWSCELNFVRGEDSVVRAVWAGSPFVWQIYPQRDGAHAAKLDAFLQRFDRFAGAAGTPVAALMRGWNGLQALPSTLPAAEPWQTACAAWREHLAGQPDLVSQLLRFVAGKLPAAC